MHKILRNNVYVIYNCTLMNDEMIAKTTSPFYPYVYVFHHRITSYFGTHNRWNLYTELYDDTWNVYTVLISKKPDQ